MTKWLDLSTEIDDELRKLNLKTDRTNQLLEALLRKPSTIEVSEDTQLNIQPQSSKIQLYTSLFPFYYHEDNGIWYKKVKRKMFNSGTSTFDASTHFGSGATNTPTATSLRSYFDTQEPILWIRYTQLGINEYAVNAGVYASKSSNINEPIIGAYQTTLFSTWGGRYPLRIDQNFMYDEVFDPPIFLHDNEDIIFYNMNLGTDDATVNLIIGYIELRKMTSIEIKNYGLDKIIN